MKTKQHLGYFNIEPDVRQGDAEVLRFPDSSFDIVYSNGFLHHVPNMQQAFREVRRMLRPGGQFIVLVHNRDPAFYMGVIAVHILSGRIFRQSLARRRSQIESTTAEGVEPVVNIYSQRELRHLPKTAGLRVSTSAIRKCTPEDLPGVSKLGAIYRAMPGVFYDKVGQWAGWHVFARCIAA